jgi:UDP-glucose 4-epimerase
VKLGITGASGFIGKELIARLDNNTIDIIEIGRHKDKQYDGNYIYVEGINSSSNFKLTSLKCDCLIHCAARVHVMDESLVNSLEKFREVNTYGTLNLAQQAANAGVKRFIFISSIKVNGESTKIGLPFRYDDNLIPTDPYGVSKYEAEVGLRRIEQETGMEVVIIRPTLVYGPGVKANFESLLNLVSRGIPLPFGCISNNRRSLVSVFNLVDLIITCIDHPKAANQVFLVSDDNDVSTASMVREMSKALGKPCRMLPVPLWCYSLSGKVFKKQDVVSRLSGSLQVDIAHTKEMLNWVPPQTVEQGFKETSKAFLKNNEKKNDSIN